MNYQTIPYHSGEIVVLGDLHYDRIAAPNGAVQIIVDPTDLGAISVVDGDDTIAVPALDESMRGKTLRQWQAECQKKRVEAALDRESRRGARDAAKRRRVEIVGNAMRAADMGMVGYTQTEMGRATLELSFGKGANEEPFVGRDEYEDPVHSGFETNDSVSPANEDQTQEEHRGDEHGVNDVVEPDGPNSLDRFRTGKKFSR